MERGDMRVVFIGTPEFSVPSLQALHNARYNIVGVITAPDRKSGRGMKLQHSAVKAYALKHDLKVLQPANLKNEKFQEELAALRADIQVVIAFRMLPIAVWDMPKYGTINLHASLLPNYRGAAPINWAIINGEKETGLTTFKLKHEIDTGDVLKQVKISIDKNETAGTLHDRMMVAGADIVVETIDAIRAGRIEEYPQLLSDEMHSAPKIYKTTCEIDWDKPGERIYNRVRGLSPYPTARTMLDGKIVKIYRCTFVPEKHARYPGNFITNGSDYLGFYCQDGLIQLNEVQLEGKKRMDIASFLRGINLS